MLKMSNLVWPNYFSLTPWSVESKLMEYTNHTPMNRKVGKGTTVLMCLSQQ